MLSKQTSLKNLYALSPAQANILHYILQTADNTAYLDQLTFNISGELDAQLMHESWQTLTNHYDILRTIFVHKGLQPLQMALEHVDVEFRFTDIQRLTPQEQQEYLQTFTQQDRAQGFNLYQDILSRVALFQLDSNRFVMVWTYHAILIDNHCSQVLQQALSQTYQALKAHQNPQLPAITSYHHYTAWLEQQAQDTSYQYWQQYLRGYETITSVPSDYSNSSQSQQSAQHSIEIDFDTTQKLYKLAQQNNVSVNTVLQAVWGYLLCYYNDCQDAAFGVTTTLTSEQFNPDTVVGLLNNIIPVRVSKYDTTYFDQLLQQVQQDLQNHQTHHYHSLVDIQQHLQFPIIDHVLCFEQASDIAEHQEIQIGLVDNVKHSGFELVVSITPMSEQIKIQFSYHTNTYSDEQIQRVAQHFQQVLHIVSQQAQLSLSSINPLSQTETQQLLFDFNPQYQGKTFDSCLSALFTKQAQIQTDKTAIVCGDKSLTYSQLNQKANQVAHYLINQGIATDDCVAIGIESDLQLSIALWGVLKAGAAYSLSGGQSANLTLHKETIDTILATQVDISEPDIQIQAHDLAYFTDQVVMVEQRNLISFCSNLASTFHWHHSDVVYSTETNTEIAALSLIGGLIFGVTVVLPSEQPMVDGLQQHQVSILQTSPQALQTLITAQGLSPLHQLSVIMLNGDCLTPALHAQLQRLDNLLVFLLQDSPETTLASHVQCLQSEADVSEIVLNEEAMYIVSKQNALLPVGAIGEICIGGAGVSRGYVDENLTQQKFIQLSDLNNDTRLYKTGYLGKRLHDGRIEQQLGKL